MNLRIFVLLGQGGRMTSPGMVSLASRLEPYGKTTVHSWNDPDVLPAIRNSTEHIAAVAYSLGANQLGWLSKYSTRPMQLGVAYDPSWLSPLVAREGGRYVQHALGFERLICYRNVGAWVWGGSTYVGKNVEEYEVSDFHLGIQFNEALHLRTIDAVRKLSKSAKGPGS